MSGEFKRVADEELGAVLTLLAGPGMMQRLDFGVILLRPEVLSRYAAAVVRKVRKHPQQLGCIREDELLAWDLNYQGFKRLLRKDEAVAVKEQVREMHSEGHAVIDNECRELLAVHHTGFTVAESGHIYRGYTNSNHGIDGEIEFKDDQSRVSGKRPYVQFKSGDSYLKKHRSDGAEVYQIKNRGWADYWQQQAYALMLVIRTSDGEIRWMDVSDWLRRASDNGRKPVKQIVFKGERFDVISVRWWRGKVLGRGLP